MVLWGMNLWMARWSVGCRDTTSTPFPQATCRVELPQTLNQLDSAMSTLTSTTVAPFRKATRTSFKRFSPISQEQINQDQTIIGCRIMTRSTIKILNCHNFKNKIKAIKAHKEVTWWALYKLAAKLECGRLLLKRSIWCYCSSRMHRWQPKCKKQKYGSLAEEINKKKIL